MNVHFDSEHATIWHGDCIEVMRELPPESVDAIVTDPPYGIDFMGKTWDDPGGMLGHMGRDGSTGFFDRPGAHSRGYADHNGRAFQAWCELWAVEALRVLKPGGHLLAFGGTRTFHRLAAGIEDAGFDIRDSIAWLYGSGFPKSLDVSKAIDKQRTEDREPVRAVCRAIRAAMDARGLKSRDLAAAFDCHSRLIDHWAARDTDSQPSLPTWEQWQQLRDHLILPRALDAEVWRLNGRKGSPGAAWDAREVTGEHTEWTDRTNYALTSRDGLRRDNPATPDAARWQGWGTALKPAFEPVVVARKPLESTVAGNVLKWGTGALNIDASRIGMSDADRAVVDVRSGATSQPDDSVIYGRGLGNRTAGDRYTSSPGGRWPANVILDESQAAALDEQSGVLTSGANPTRRSSDKFRDTYSPFKGQTDLTPARGADSGGASRFFYTAKASTDERPNVDGVAHPTVKPLDLMRWLVRLVTPKGGTVLEPFAGSGTTVEAAVLEGFRCIAIEREADYLPLIMQRISKPHAIGLDFDWEDAS